MRTIKFRAWDKFNKCWVPVNGQDPYTLKQLADDDLFSYHKEIHPISSRWQNYDWVQFTGLTDKNGKEIYEGDIVQLYGFSDKYKISYGNGCFYLEGIEDFTQDIMFSYQESNKVEVIGNVYENPELLKGGETI